MADQRTLDLSRADPVARHVEDVVDRHVAAQLLPSSVAASIMALAPLVLAGLAWPLLRQRPTARWALGSVLGIAGVVLIVGLSAGGVSPAGVVASAIALSSAKKAVCAGAMAVMIAICGRTSRVSCASSPAWFIPSSTTAMSGPDRSSSNERGKPMWLLRLP